MSDVITSKNPTSNTPDAGVLKQERYEILHRLENWLESPMLILTFIWLALLIPALLQERAAP